MTHEELGDELFEVASKHGNKLNLSSAAALIYLIGAIVKTHQEDALLQILYRSDSGLRSYIREASEALSEKKEQL